MKKYKNLLLNRKINVENRVVKIIIIFFLLFYSLRLLGDRNELYILHDEFGYWAIAAKYARYNWDSLMQNSSYYSYFYSLFLYPLFALNLEAAVMYKIAIIFNSIMIVSSFILSCWFSSKVFNNKYIIIRDSVCGIVACYTYVALNVNYAWPEIMLYFSFWILVCLIYRFTVKCNMINFSLILIVSITMFFIHQRTLGVMIATCIILVAIVLFYKQRPIHLIVNNKKNWIYLFFVLAIFVLGILVKKYNLENIFSDNKIVDRNNFSGQISKINHIFTLQGIFDLFVALLGKIFYFNVATFTLGGYGILIIINSIIKECRNLKNYNRLLSQKLVIEIFILLSFISSIGIASIATMINWSILPIKTRPDVLIYGRYFEFMISPILIYGIIGMTEIRKNKKIYFINIIFFLISTIFTQKAMKEIIPTGKVELNASGFNIFFWNINEYNEIIFFGAASILAIALLLYILNITNMKSGFYITLSIIFLCWLTYNYKNDQIILKREEENKKYVYSTLNFLSDFDQYNFCYVYSAEKDDVFKRYIYYLQYNLYDKRIETLSYDEKAESVFEMQKNVIYILLGDSKLKDEFLKEYKLLYSNNVINLFTNMENE